MNKQKRNDIRKIATILHKKMCHSNHNDACDWEYDTGNWECYARKKYFKKAELLLLICNVKKLTKILEAL